MKNTQHSSIINIPSLSKYQILTKKDLIKLKGGIEQSGENEDSEDPKDLTSKLEKAILKDQIKCARALINGDGLW